MAAGQKVLNTLGCYVVQMRWMVIYEYEVPGEALDGRLVYGQAGIARKHSGLIQAHCAPCNFDCLLSSTVGAHAVRV
jgi:hypothetical protein